MTNNYDERNENSTALKERDRLIERLNSLDGDRLKMVDCFLTGLEEMKFISKKEKADKAFKL